MIPADTKIGRSSAAAFLVAFLLVIMIGAAHAEWNYWLKFGGTKIIKCAGDATEGSLIKLANPDGQWIYIDGIANCKESGSSYAIEIKFLKVSINSARSGDIAQDRDPIKFDWIGVELYRQMDGQERIEWLFHDEKPIQGSLPNLADKRIVFGKLQFMIPKSKADRATRMTFYLTAQNIPFRFFVL
jgi:hypothetical protein